MQRTRVPPELIDQIIDCSHSDVRSLATYALVSRTWLPRSRFHLFKHPILESRTFHAFLALTHTSHCSFLHLVRAITMSGSGWKSLMTAIKGLAVLPALENLRLARIILGSESAVTSFSQFKVLELSDVTFPSFPHLTDFIAAFEPLEHLEMRTVGWFREHDPERTGSMAPPGLQVVQLGAVSKVPVVQWLTARPVSDPPRVHTVSLMLSRSTEIRPAVQYLRNLGPSLEHLELTQFMGAWATDGRAKELDLSHNTALRSLHLHPGQCFDGWILSMLSQIHSPTFTDLILTFDNGPKFLPYRSPLTFDGLLSAKTLLPTLKRVHVKLTHPHFNLKLALHAIRRLLPMCEQRGMVMLSLEPYPPLRHSV